MIIYDPEVQREK